MKLEFLTMPHNTRSSQTKKSEAIVTDKIALGGTIEEIFKYENPSIKDVLTILKEIHSSQQFIAAKYDEMITTNLELQSTCNKLIIENADLKEEIKGLKQDLREIEKRTNEKKIEIQGIPKVKDENLNEIIAKIGEAFNVAIKTEDIDEIYRIENKENIKRNNPIVVTFGRKCNKEKFLTMRKKRSIYTNELNICETRSQIFINEYLPKKIKELLWKTKQVKIEKGYRFVWVRNGSIYLRKLEKSEAIQINCQEDLQKLD